MMVGIPGAGIGGLFYILNALWMPFHEARLAIQGRSSLERWRMVKRQVTIALGILASLGVTGWLLGLALTTHLTSAAVLGLDLPHETRRELPRLFTYAALLVTLTTLALVQAGVTVLRFLVRPKRAGLASAGSDRPAAASKKSASCAGIIVLLALFFHQAPIQAAQNSTSALILSEHLKRADAAFEEEDSAVAEQEYRAALKGDPGNPRAMFRLGQLLDRRDPKESERLFRSYIALEPGDAWGYIAVAQILKRQSRNDEALKFAAEAVRRAPQERDAVLVQAEILARANRTERAIEEFEKWLASHPDDAEAWLALARERERAGRTTSARTALERAASNHPVNDTSERLESLSRATAPAFEPVFGFSRDSDGNMKVRTALGGDFVIGDGARLGLSFGRTRVDDNVDTQSYSDFTLTTKWRPRANLELDAAGGAARTDRIPGGMQIAAEFIPTARLRLRAAAPGNAAHLDIRFNRNLVDATPTLLARRIVRNDLQVRPVFALPQHLRLRGIGGTSLIQGNGDRNHRYTLGGGPAWSPAPALEWSANFTQSSYSHDTKAGYFAPEKIQTIETATYIEFERDAVLVALDVGGGLERFKEFGFAFGRWRPALRGYGLLSLRLRPGRELRLEIDSYNTQAGPVLVPTSGWKYVAATASFRWALP